MHRKRKKSYSIRVTSTCNSCDETRLIPDSLTVGLPLHFPLMMIPIVMVWLYFALLVSAMQWPNILSMLVTFVLLGTVPVFMLFRLLMQKRLQNRLNQHGTDGSMNMHSGVGNIDQQNPGKD